MAEGTLSPAAERILAAAMELFARQGYEKTSVGEIQEAAGLTFGSGALYKHFRSKEAVLAEGVERLVHSARQDHKLVADLDGVDITEGLGMIARSAMRSFAQDQDLLRIAWRDLEQFPDLQEKVRSERIRATFDQFASWLAGQGDHGRTAEQDSAAVAAVALSSLAFFQLLHFLLHDTPGGFDEERFVEAWTGIFGAALRSG